MSRAITLLKLSGTLSALAMVWTGEARAFTCQDSCESQSTVNVPCPTLENPLRVCPVVEPTTLAACYTFQAASCGDLSLELWGEAGRLGYPAAASIMDGKGSDWGELSECEKVALAPHYGGLVDRVRIHYHVLPMDKWGQPPYQISLTGVDTGAQTYGHDIYFEKEAAAYTDAERLGYLVHELVHSQQFEDHDSSLGDFGYAYFKGFKKANLVYENNEFELAATDQAAAVIGAVSESFEDCMCPDPEPGDVTVADWGYADRRWLVDVTGEGRADYCRAVGSGSGEGSFLACSLDITSSGANDTMVPIPDWGYADRRWFADVNGDGGADYCRAVGSGSGEGSFLACSLDITSSGANDTMVPIPDWGYADRRWFADVDGDGKVDFCRAVGAGSGDGSFLACSLDIASSGANDTLVPIPDWGYADRRWFADVNGDGGADFCRAVGAGSGDGSFLACSLDITSSGANDTLVPIADWGYEDRRWFADVDGDGRADFCRAVGAGSGDGSFLACSLDITNSGGNDAMVPIAEWGHGDRRWLAEVGGEGASLARGVGRSGGECSYFRVTEL